LVIAVEDQVKSQNYIIVKVLKYRIKLLHNIVRLENKRITCLLFTYRLCSAS